MTDIDPALLNYRPVYVTRAQVNAARIMAWRMELRDETPPESVIKIAEAKS